MKKLILVISFLAIAGCSSSSLTPIQTAACDIETAVSNGLASSVASALSCTNTAAIQTSFLTALGNANFCPATSSAQSKVSVKGAVGNIVCPLAVSTILGFLSNSVPSSWGCSASTDAGSLSTALTTACEAIVPI